MARCTLLAVLLGAVLCQAFCVCTARRLVLHPPQRALLDDSLGGCIWEDSCFLGSEYLANYVQSAANVSKQDDTLKTYVSYALYCSSILSNEKCTQATFCSWDASSPTPSYGCSIQEAKLNQLQQACVTYPYQTILAALQSCRSDLTRCAKGLHDQQQQPSPSPTPLEAATTGRRLAQGPSTATPPTAGTNATTATTAGSTQACASIVSCMLSTLVGGGLNVAAMMEAASGDVLPKLEALQFTVLGEAQATALADSRRHSTRGLLAAAPLPAAEPTLAPRTSSSSSSSSSAAPGTAHHSRKESAALAAALLADASAYLPPATPLPLLPLPLPLADPFGLLPALVPQPDGSADDGNPNVPESDPSGVLATHSHPQHDTGSTQPHPTASVDSTADASGTTPTSDAAAVLASAALSRTLLKLLQDTSSPHEWAYYHLLDQTFPTLPVDPLVPTDHDNPAATLDTPAQVDAPTPNPGSTSPSAFTTPGDMQDDPAPPLLPLLPALEPATADPTLAAPARETLAADPPTPSTHTTDPTAAPPSASPSPSPIFPTPGSPLQNQLQDPTAAATLIATDIARVSSSVASAASSGQLPADTVALLTNVSLDLSLLAGDVAGRAANNAGGADPLLVAQGASREIHTAAQKLLCGMPAAAAARAALQVPLLQLLALELEAVQAYWAQLVALAPSNGSADSGWGAGHGVAVLAGALGYLLDLRGVCEAAPPAVPGFSGRRSLQAAKYSAAVAQSVVLLTGAALTGNASARQAASAWMPQVASHLEDAVRRTLLLAALAEASPSGDDTLDTLLQSVPQLAPVTSLQRALQPACDVLLAASRQARQLVNWRATSTGLPAAGSAAAAAQLGPLVASMDGLVVVLGAFAAPGNGVVSRGLGMGVALQARMCGQGRRSACGQAEKLAAALAQSESLTAAAQTAVAQLLIAAAQQSANCSLLAPTACAAAPSCTLGAAPPAPDWTPDTDRPAWAAMWTGPACRADLQAGAQLAARWEAEVKSWAPSPPCGLVLRAVPACDALPATDTCSETPFCAPYSWASDGSSPNLRRAVLLQPPSEPTTTPVPGQDSACLPNWETALDLLLGKSAVDSLRATAKNCAAQATAAACEPDAAAPTSSPGAAGSVELVNGQQRTRSQAGQAFLSRYWPHIVGVVGGATFALLIALAIYRWHRVHRNGDGVLSPVAATGGSSRRARKASKRHRRRGSTPGGSAGSSGAGTGVTGSSGGSTTSRGTGSVATPPRAGSTSSTANLLAEPAQAFRVYEIPSMRSDVSLPGYSYAPPGTSATGRPPPPPPLGGGLATAAAAGLRPSTSAAGGYGPPPGGPDLMRFSGSFSEAVGQQQQQQALLAGLPSTRSYTSYGSFGSLADLDRVAIALALSQQDSNPYPTTSTNLYATPYTAFPSHPYPTPRM